VYPVTGQSSNPRNRRDLKVALACTGFVFFMVGMSFAAVPLYDLFCRVTGFGGTTQQAEAASDTVLEETILVRFDGNVANGLPWRFRPKETRVELRIGEVGKMVYIAENIGDTTTTGTSTYNVSPPQIGAFFMKMECFCFTEQPLEPGETMEMPVVFFVDPAIVDDTDGQSTREITLSYTFFPVRGTDGPLASGSDESGGKPL
jgi:cytochrome c oxidase assembly protein subunit 11